MYQYFTEYWFKWYENSLMDKSLENGILTVVTKYNYCSPPGVLPWTTYVYHFDVSNGKQITDAEVLASYLFSKDQLIEVLKKDFEENSESKVGNKCVYDDSFTVANYSDKSDEIDGLPCKISDEDSIWVKDGTIYIQLEEFSGLDGQYTPWVVYTLPLSAISQN